MSVDLAPATSPTTPPLGLGLPLQRRPATTAPVADRAGVAGPPRPSASSLSSDAWARQVHDLHARPLLRFLTSLARGDREAAEDLVQEVLVRALRHRDRLGDDIASLRPWLFTVGRRLAIDLARARTARPQETALGELLDAGAVADHSDHVVLRHLLREALATLSPQHRDIVLDLYVRQLSVAQAADRHGVPAGTVKSRAYYALRRLRDALDEASRETGALAG